jgi:hypothetical protein
MNGRIRVNAGYGFEKDIRLKNNFERYIKSPRIKWSGIGRNNVNKIISLGKNPELFMPIMEESKFVKADARNKDGSLYEIKKYSRKDLKKFRLYSEPIIKVCPTRSKWGVGNPFFDNFNGSDEYNEFIYNLTKTEWWKNQNQKILENICMSNEGIFSIDGLIPNSELDFKWVINKGEYGCIFDNYYRLSIVVKIKELFDIIKKNNYY